MSGSSTLREAWELYEKLRHGEAPEKLIEAARRYCRIYGNRRLCLWWFAKSVVLMRRRLMEISREERVNKYESLESTG